MTAMQVFSVLAAACVGLWYLWPLLPVGNGDPGMLVHLKNIIAVRDAYKTPAVTERCNALMEALLGTKP